MDFSFHLVPSSSAQKTTPLQPCFERVTPNTTSAALTLNGHRRPSIRPRPPGYHHVSGRYTRMASSSSSSAPAVVAKHELLAKVRGHEVAIAELKSLNDSRSVYQKYGNIFFRKDVKAAMASEQEQLDLTKPQMEKSSHV